MGRHGQGVFAPIVAAAAIAVLGGIAAQRATRAASSFHTRLNIPRPPLGAARPFLVTPPGPPLSRRVVIVVIDGLRLDRSFGHPWLDGLRRIGAEAIGRSHFPTWSRPNHATIVTGVPPLASGVRTNAYDFPVALDSLMDRANAAGERSAYVADVAFGMARMFHDDFEAMHYVPWEGGLDKAIRLVVAQGYPLLVVLPGAVDEAGHQHGADSRAYREAVASVDHLLAGALAGLDLTRDTLIVTSDHGHLDVGGHGGTEREVVEVPVILAGAGIRPGAALGDVQLASIAPTAAVLLGVAPPGHGTAPALTAALALDPARRTAIDASDHQRIVRNLALVEQAEVATAARATAVRRPRLAGVVAALVLAGVLLVLLRRSGAIDLDGRVLVIALPAFPLAFYALLDLVGGRFSLSAVPDRPDALDRLFVFGLIATGVQVVASWVALHGRHVLRERLAAATGLTAAGLYLAAIPAGVLWALYDPESRPLVVAAPALVVAPAAWIAVAFVALATAVTLALELVIFFARGTDPRAQRRGVDGTERRAGPRDRRRGLTDRRRQNDDDGR